MKHLILWLFLVCWCSYIFKFAFAIDDSMLLLLSFFLSFHPFISLLRATGFVVHFLLSEPSFKNAGLSSDRHWSKEMRNDLHSLAPLHFHLPYYYQTHAPHRRARAHAHAHMCARTGFTHFHRWLVKSPEINDTQICMVVRGFLSKSTFYDTRYIRQTLTPRSAMASAHN